jgi:type I restriction enzyme S subunit
MSELPQGWAEATVLELAGQNSVVTDGDWVESKDQDPMGSVRLIQLADIGDGFFVNKSQRFMNVESVERLNCTYLQNGDVLIARMPDPLGRACIFPDIGQHAVTAVDVFVWRPDRELAGADTRWLMHTINSPAVRAEILSEAGGTTRQRVAGGKLKQLRLPVPPIPEQRRIVATVDGLTARTARARKELDRIPTLIARYKQRLLALAFSGELTAGWRAAKGLSDAKEVALVDVAKGFSYGTSAKSAPSGEVPVLRMGNIQDGKLDWTNLVFTSEKAEIKKYTLIPGDVLFNRTNSPELVGKTALYKGEQDAVYAGYLIRIQCTENLMPEYLTYSLNGPAGRNYCWAVKTDGVSQSNINAKKIAAFRFLLPSLDEQAEIVRRIDSAFGWLDRMAADHAAAARLLPKLDAAILAKAFQGKLVPQDPNDEPAAKLLERIKAEPGIAPKGKRGGRANLPPITGTAEITLGPVTVSATGTVGNAPTRARKVSMTKSRQDDDVKDKPYLAGLLKSGRFSDAQSLFRAADLPVSDFYKQLAWEIDKGHILDNTEELKAA